MELSDIQVSSKTQSAEKIKEILEAGGYETTEVKEETVGGEGETEPTPEETEAAAKDTAEKEKADKEAADAVKNEEKEKTTRNERRRLARERDQASRDAAIERADKAERELAELRESQTKLAGDIEEFRKNPPKPIPDLVAPKRPKKPLEADYFEAANPAEAFREAAEAYDESFADYRDAKREHERAVAERAKPKETPAPVKAAPAKEAPATEEFDLSKVTDPIMKRFYKSVETVQKTHTGASKLLSDNIVNLNEAMITAVHPFDEPARIALYLAEHPEESKRIKGLTEGKVTDDPRRVRIATRELEKIETLAAEEDAAAAKAADEDEGDDTGDESDPETDASVARKTPQPTRKPDPDPAKAAADKATAAAEAAKKPAPPKKHTPITPVGARGTHSAKSYNEMTPDEQRALSVDEVRKLRGML